MNSSVVDQDTQGSHAQYNNLRKDLLFQAGEYLAATDGGSNDFTLQIDTNEDGANNGEAISSIIEGHRFRFKASASITAVKTNTPTLTIEDGAAASILAATEIRKGGIKLEEGDIVEGGVYEACFDGTYISLLNPARSPHAGGISLVAGEGVAAGNTLSRAELGVAAANPTLDADTYVNENSPGTNYNSADPLSMREVGTADDRWIFLDFSGFSAVDLVDQIQEFDLNIYIDPTSGSGNVIAYAVEAAWNPATITWTNKPAISAVELGRVAVPASGYTARTIPCSVPTIAISNQIKQYGICLKIDFNTAEMHSLETAAGTPATITNLVETNTQAVKAFKADASFEASINGYLGIAKETAALNDKVAFARRDFDDNQAGMTENDTMYLSDTPGAIQNSPGTNSKEVGKAWSATRLEIKTVY